MTVFNMDVAGYIRRLRAMKNELVQSNSAKLPAISDADLKRFRSHLESLEQYAVYACDQCELDLPKWSPKEIELGESVKVEGVSNHSIIDILAMVEAVEVEMVQSQSARQSSGLISHDEERLDAIMGKIHALLDSFVSTVPPQDLPNNL